MEIQLAADSGQQTAGSRQVVNWRIRKLGNYLKYLTAHGLLLTAYQLTI